MDIRGKSLKASVLLTAGEGVNYGASFIRNMILARLLTKADFGVAATFAMIIALLEFTAKTGVARFVVRDENGNNPNFISTAHLMQFSAGAISAAIILAAAWPLSLLFGIPGKAQAVMLLALIPLCRGCEHLDVRRYERELRFGPSSLVEVIPQILITIATWPVAIWLGDFRAVLVILLAKAFLSCITSHLFAERVYRWSLETTYVRQILQFGWPLIVNGFLMFGMLQGEQFLVATFYHMADLGAYAAAVGLVLAPTYLFGRIVIPIILPVMAKVQQDPEAFRRRYSQVASAMALFAAVSSVGLILGGEAFMRLVYGHKYEGLGAIFGSMAAVSALRNIRIATSVTALAKGDSQNEMRSNGARLMGLLPAFILAVLKQPLWLIASTGLLGEAVACWVSVARLRRRDGIPLAATLVPLGWVLLWVLAAGGAVWSGVYTWPTLVGLLVASGGAIAAGSWMIVVLPVLREEAMRLWQAMGSFKWSKMRRFISLSP